MLKKIVLLLLLFWGQQYCFAQFSRATLQATGLTCALCSKAIHQALERLPFVQKVSAQIKESSFEVLAKPGESIDPAAIRVAVEEAGFFIGALYLMRATDAPLLVSNTSTKEGNNYFMVVGALKDGGVQTFQVLNEHFLTEKAFSKLSNSSLGAQLKQQPTLIEGLPVFYLKSQ